MFIKMKKTLLTITILTICNIVYSQPFGEAANQYKITELHYHNSIGEKGATYFKYDLHDKLTKSIWTLKNKKRYSVNYYQQNEKGKIIAAFRDFSDGLTSFENFDYDTTGNKISENFYRSDNICGSATYFYEGKLLKKAIYKSYKGFLTGNFILKYNKYKQKEKGTLTDKGKIVAEIFYEYDKTGNLIKELWDFNGKWNQTFNYKYTQKNTTRHFYSSPFFSNQGNYRIIKEAYNFNDETKGPSLYEYDENGRLQKKIFLRSDSLKTNTHYHYDNQNRLILSKRVYSDKKEAKFTYEYDDQNRLVKRNFYKADTLSGFEYYLYNAEGELSKAFFKNFDGWISGTIQFENDKFGNVTKGHFKGEDGFDALITFSYDEHLLVSEIRWQFSFGKFQNYTFMYEHINNL